MVGETVWVPETALLPVQAPEAVQEVRLKVEDQLKVEELPEVILVGDAVKLKPGDEGGEELGCGVGDGGGVVEVLTVTVTD